MHNLFDDLLPFVYVAENESFRKAAAKLGLTPAAVSKSVQRLEKRLGVQLLHRTTRQVALSHEGSLFLARCKNAMSELQMGHDEVSQYQEIVQGTLTVSLPMILGRFVVQKLGGFRQRYPKLTLHLRFTDQYSNLIDEQVDIAIRIGALEDSTLISRALMKTRWVTVASPGYIATHGLPEHPSTLQSHQCLKFHSTRGVPVEWIFLDPQSKQTEIYPTPLSFSSDQGDILLEAALSGQGICQAFSFMTQHLLQKGHLLEVCKDYAADGPPIHALTTAGRQHSPRIRVFIDYLLTIFDE
ncbi:MAG TPA: LysR family transcriptional regulator [Myxococcales bacterium]|nr:LysR family transcriptional regulator [Deltaproteobacteria bacterium]HAA54833.1 LysR family transcriptional regulator [Myxococcales bacterium]|tara:strand:+ start:23898 stop:24791 length:894 start_codon:yes stop_codon:yes gene_type:complete